MKTLYNYYRVVCRNYTYPRQLSTIKFIITILLLTYLVLIPFIPMFFLYEKYIGQMGGPVNIKEVTFLFKIIFASILGPLFETLIFQYGIIEILSSIKVFKKNNLVLIIISAILFGLSHNYSYLYIFYSFLIGLLLAYSYLVYKNKKFSAFWIVFWIHFIRNTISSIIFILII